MSCKRSDITNLKGCRIGDVAIRGCDRGCCPYPDDKISQNTRYHLLDTHSPLHLHNDSPAVPGRTGLYYSACQTSWRPKFICPKPQCRRSIKPSYDPDRNDYRFSEFGDWEVRPKVENELGLKTAFTNQRRLGSTSIPESREKREVMELWKRFSMDGSDGATLSEVEFERLKMYQPNLWWRKVITIPRAYVRDEAHLVRCPSCGESAVRVGSTFRVPKKGDEKGWKEVEGMIERGEDMAAKFSLCSTVEVHEEMVEEAQMRRGKKETEALWQEEKKIRIEGLGLRLKG